MFNFKAIINLNKDFSILFNPKEVNNHPTKSKFFSESMGKAVTFNSTINHFTF